MNRHVIRCAIVGVIPRVFWIEQVMANTNQAMPLTHTNEVRPHKDHRGVGINVSAFLHPKVRALVNRFYRRKTLLDADFALAMRQAKEAAEQLIRSSKLQDQT